MSAPSEVLVRAADLIRDTAAKATPGPWEADREFAHANVVYAKHDLIDSVGVAGRRLDLPRVFTGQIASRERARFEADARWIALMSPAVAEHLETWLRDTASRLEAWLEVTGWPIREGESAAIRFALSVLGMTVGEAERAGSGIPEETP